MSLQSTWSCIRPSTRCLASASRSFSTTSSALSNVPPESPSYIRLPSAPQSDETKPARVRGHLPVPRDIFPRNDGSRKMRPDYLKKSAPQRTKNTEPTSEVQQWKRELADARRKNLGESLDSLWARRQKKDAIHNTYENRKFKENRKALLAPEREDERLTRSTVLDAIKDTKVYPDPDRFARADRSRSRVQVRENQKREARRDALMELYISASNFITQESELKAEIDKVFTEDYFRKQGQTAGRYAATENAWGVYGKPPSIGNMLEATTGTSTKLMDFDESEYDRSVKRQKRIAEEFTGGKME